MWRNPPWVFLLDVRDGNSELRCREEILLRVIECAERLGVAFAVSTGTVHPVPNSANPGGPPE